jgi:glycine/D-amino acid oxidase-like deaminating enzyme
VLYVIQRCSFLGTSDEKINGWGTHAFEHYKELYHSKDSVEAGVQLLDCYQAFEAHEQTAVPAWKDIVFNFQELSESDLRKMGLPKKYVRGFKFGTFVIDQKYYMRYLTRRLVEVGVVFEQKRLEGMDEVISRGFDCIVNCTGLGATVVAGDSSMYPIRGQVLRVK